MRVLCRLMAIATLVLGACASGPLASRVEESPDRLSVVAITSVNVLPMTAGEPLLRQQTVLIEDGRIAAIAPSGSLPIPADALRIDGRGKYLMPGLADMHVHLEHFDDPIYLKLFLVYGVTTVRSMDGRPNILDWRCQAAAGALPSPDIYTAGQVLDGSPPVRDDNVALATAAEARRAVEEQANSGYDFIKVYANLAPDVFQAIIEAAAEHDVPVVGHMPRTLPLDLFLSSGVRSIEHLSDFADEIATRPAVGSTPPNILKRRLGFPADPGRMVGLATRVAASGVWVVPTIIADDRLVAAPSVVDEWATAPEVRAIDRGIVQYWRDTLQRAADRVGPDNWSWVAEGNSNRRALTGAFFRAGVPLLAGTDTPQPFVFPGASLHLELANYVEAGLTPAQALATATREPARFLGQDQTWGTVEPGKRANLLLLDANPLEDITATRRIAGVVKGGRWMSREQLLQMRQEVERLAASSE